MAEQAVERIGELRVRRQFEHRRRARGPALRRSDRQRLLRREMVKEGPFRDPRGGADLVDAGRGIAFAAHGLMRRGDQLGARISALRPVLGRGVSRRHATRHTDWLVCCQIARLDARCAALSPTSAKRLDLPALSLTRVRGTKRESMVAIVSTTAYLGLEARAVEVQCQIAPGMPGFSSEEHTSELPVTNATFVCRLL